MWGGNEFTELLATCQHHAPSLLRTFDFLGIHTQRISTSMIMLAPGACLGDTESPVLGETQDVK